MGYNEENYIRVATTECSFDTSPPPLKIPWKEKKKIPHWLRWPRGNEILIALALRTHSRPVGNGSRRREKCEAAEVGMNPQYREEVRLDPVASLAQRRRHHNLLASAVMGLRAVNETAYSRHAAISTPRLTPSRRRSTRCEWERESTARVLSSFRRNLPPSGRPCKHLVSLHAAGNMRSRRRRRRWRKRFVSLEKQREDGKPNGVSKRAGI